jgi:hypothetical protein
MTQPKADNSAMKVLDLQCDAEHVFEGWFASEADYVSQQARLLIACPMCGSQSISKMLSAPRLNLGAAQPVTAQAQLQADASASRPASPPANSPTSSQATATQDITAVAGGNPELMLQAAWLQVARQIVTQTEDVGPRFAEEARKIHYGESEQRGIRGQASREETAALLEEGIEVMPLSLPESLKGSLQ